MTYGRRDPSFFDSFTLSPVPYPVLLILSVVLLLLGMSSFFAYEDIVEEAEETANWLLLASPIVLLLLIRWLPSAESFDELLRWSRWLHPYDRLQQGYYGYYGHLWSSEEGGSPWGVAAVMVLVLIMVFCRSLLA